MATLILSTVGTAVAGPIGGAIGALAGRAIDTSVIGKPEREGPRLTELAVTTSSYGQPVPRIYGTVRAPGTIIWATELAESSQTTSGKGQPTTTSYSYSSSFAVAMSSRPVSALGRIWADGALLRGTAGDLKVGGTMRLHHGLGDEVADPLIEADKGAHACAFRSLAYVVFEDLQLASFGNRIPALSFEVIASDGALDLVDLLDETDFTPVASVPLPGLAGYADHGGSRADLVASVARVYPLVVTSDADGLSVQPVEVTSTSPLPTAVTGRSDGDAHAQPLVRRGATDLRAPSALRYYDAARDFLPSVQQAPGAGGSESEVVEFAGVFDAVAAQARIAAMRHRALTTRETLAYRVAEPTAGTAPGRCVTREGDLRQWLVRSSEWHSDGVDLLLERIVGNATSSAIADPGVVVPPIDERPGELRLRYFELPWDGLGASNVPQRFAAASLAGARTAIPLLRIENESLFPTGVLARGNAIQGESLTALPGSPAMLFEALATLNIALSSASDQLQSVDELALLNGANRLLLGEEILQFRHATPLGGGHWRLAGLLRGRGGTAHHAAAGHSAGTAAVVLDEYLTPLGAMSYLEIGADSGLGDSDPAYATLASAGSTLQPLAPVHPRLTRTASSDPEWRWIRRARGAWHWFDGIDVPLVEEREIYRVGFGPVDAPVSHWDVIEPCFTLAQADWASLSAGHPSAQLWVRQVGSHSVSCATALPH